MLLLLLLLLIVIHSTDSYISYTPIQDFINVFNDHNNIILSINSIDLSYKPSSLPLAPLIQPSFDDLRMYAQSVSAILKQDVDSAAKIIT